MKPMKTIMVGVSILGLLLTTGAFAAQQGAAENDIKKQTGSSEGVRSDISRASKLIGADVENQQGEDLGQIEDVVIDRQDGSVAYAVLSFGGFLGVGEKYFAIPWKALHPKADDEEGYILNVDKERLENAPGFNKNDWPNMADRRWGQEIHAYYGQQPYWERHERLRQEARMRDDKAVQSSMDQRHTVSATVQSVNEDTGRLSLRTADGEIVELKAPDQLAGTLQAGDSVDVVIRKIQMAEESSKPGQTQRDQAPSKKSQNK